MKRYLFLFIIAGLCLLQNANQTADNEINKKFQILFCTNEELGNVVIV
jgi:hypothetical protein